MIKVPDIYWLLRGDRPNRVLANVLLLHPPSGTQLVSKCAVRAHRRIRDSPHLHYQVYRPVCVAADPHGLYAVPARNGPAIVNVGGAGRGGAVHGRLGEKVGVWVSLLPECVRRHPPVNVRRRVVVEVAGGRRSRARVWLRWLRR